jgi:hypothetical protein
MKKVISILVIGFVFTSCEMSEEQKQYELKKVDSFKVVDVETGDTIEVFISDNSGIPCTAFRVSK